MKDGGLCSAQKHLRVCPLITDWKKAAEIKSKMGKTTQKQFCSHSKRLGRSDSSCLDVSFNQNMHVKIISVFRIMRISVVDLWRCPPPAVSFFLSVQEEKSISGAGVAAQGQMVAHVMITESPR